MSNQLLVPLDGSSLADAAATEAIRIARRLQLGVILTRIHSPTAILPYPPEVAVAQPLPDWDAGVRARSKAWLEEKATTLTRSGGVTVSAEFRIGNPAEEIVTLATMRGVRAIVCTTLGVGGPAPHWIGSVADAVIRHAPCPVFALPPGAMARSDELRTLLVLLDGSHLSDEILPHAEWLAGAFDAELELMSVASPPWVHDALAALAALKEDPFGIDVYAANVKKRLETVAAEIRRKGLRVRSTVEIGASPARTILEHIKRNNPDAVALATHGRGASRLFLGSVADKVLRTSGRPTFLLRPQHAAVLEDAARSQSAEAGVLAGWP
jgi:nucleotide-binding universal stress UspA family protein